MSELAPKHKEAVQPIAVNDNDSPHANDNLRVTHEPIPHKRRKSWGEHLFNATTYGGIVWIGNEALSTVIWNWVKKNGSMANRLYESTVAKLPAWGEKPFRMFVLTIGGSSLVPIVKALEDNKGKLVRYADARLEGKKAQNDPELEKAHHDMDIAPKQSWSTLWKGRAVVLAGAVGLDYLCGDDTAPTRRWLQDTRFDKYSTMERAGTSLARDAMSIRPFSWFVKSDAERTAITTARKASDFTKLTAAEGKAANVMGGTFGFVLILSAILSACFYISSRVFAFKRDEKQHRNETIHELEKAGVIPQKKVFLDQEILSNAPSTSISNAVHDNARLQIAEPSQDAHIS